MNLEICETADKIAIMAPGPSLTKDQIDMIMRKDYFTIVIGSAVFLNPFSELLYHCDRQWWDYYNGVPEFYGCQRISLENTKFDNIHTVIESDKKIGLDLTPPRVVTGRNSGYQAINLAVHFRPSKIILVGYDMKKSNSGQYNVIGDHPRSIKRPSNFKGFIENFRTLPEQLDNLGISVYNCTTDSDLDCFPKENLINVL